jgi:hypothetical protein
MTQSLIVGNAAEGGAAGSGGQAGKARGGGVYNDQVDGATIQIDALTFIHGNEPDDRSGC